MKWRLVSIAAFALVAVLALGPCVTVEAQQGAVGGAALRSGPPFPRIANLYGSGLGWVWWKDGQHYWRKLDLIVGGGYDFHSDWTNPEILQRLALMRENIRKLRSVDPRVVILTYVDVADGVYNASVPTSFWKKGPQGNRLSRWPGLDELDTDNPEYLDFTFQNVKRLIFDLRVFNGVFFDSWQPEARLAGRTAALAPGRFFVMTNPWNLPDRGFRYANGVLAEDELNRVVEGKVDFGAMLRLYIDWTERSLKPPLTTLVCHPRGVNQDAWRWAKLSNAQRDEQIQAARTSDPQMMRFGLATALMGDGYFAYDMGTQRRGSWWWYHEYDAPLGYPLGPAKRLSAELYERHFDGGVVVVNGGLFRRRIRFPARMKDYSTGAVGTAFTLRSYDGRIYVPAY